MPLRLDSKFSIYIVVLAQTKGSEYSWRHQDYCPEAYAHPRNKVVRGCSHEVSPHQGGGNFKGILSPQMMALTARP